VTPRWPDSVTIPGAALLAASELADRFEPEVGLNVLNLYFALASAFVAVLTAAVVADAILAAPERRLGHRPARRLPGRLSTVAGAGPFSRSAFTTFTTSRRCGSAAPAPDAASPSCHRLDTGRRGSGADHRARVRADPRRTRVRNRMLSPETLAITAAAAAAGATLAIAGRRVLSLPQRM
jgi:hypothetical protein